MKSFLDPSKKRTLIIGDVHGCFQELTHLLISIKYQYKTDQLIFVGDLINKGPASREVLEFVFNHKAQVVIGNHEMGLIRYIDQDIKDGHSLSTVKLSLGKDLHFWINWMRSLPSFIEYDDFTIVHAGKIPNKQFSEDDRTILCTMRTCDKSSKDFQNPVNPPWYVLYHESKLIVYGHNAALGLVERENSIGLDTGCVYGRQLSLLSLPDRKIYQIDAARQYFPIDS
jgi:serine/threonine protein phosphatase 1